MNDYRLPYQYPFKDALSAYGGRLLWVILITAAEFLFLLALFALNWVSGNLASVGLVLGALAHAYAVLVALGVVDGPGLSGSRSKTNNPPPTATIRPDPRLSAVVERRQLVERPPLVEKPETPQTPPTPQTPTARDRSFDEMFEEARRLSKQKNDDLNKHLNKV
jgi:hypothetical protein